MKKIIYLILLLFLSLFLIGCEDRFNIEQTTYIDSIGLDYDIATQNYIMYFHISASSALLRDGASGESKYSIGKTESPNLYEAFRIFSKSVTGTLSLTHVQSFIFTDNFVTIENMNYFVEVVKTYDYLTPNFYCFYTDSDIEDLFSLENPENVSPFFSIINSSDYVTTYKLTYFTDLAKAVYEKYLILKLTMIRATDSIWKNDDNEITSVIPVGEFYLDSSGNSMTMEIDEYTGVIILNHDYTSTIILDGINFNVYNQKITIKEKNGVFTMKIRGNVYATHMKTSTFKETISIFEREVENEIIKVANASKETNFDIFNLRDILYRKNKLKDDFNYKTVQINYDIKYNLLN